MLEAVIAPVAFGVIMLAIVIVALIARARRRGASAKEANARDDADRQRRSA